MPTMKLALNLSAETAARLTTAAVAAGCSPEELARRIIERSLAILCADRALSDFRSQVAQSGISDQDLDALLDALREQVWRECSRGTRSL